MNIRTALYGTVYFALYLMRSYLYPLE